MRSIRAIPTQLIPLGRLGENECTQILFDVSGWLEEYPSAAIGLYNLRPGDTESYPVASVTLEDSTAIWTITNTELSAVGKGRCELVALQDGVVAKSSIYTTVIGEALDGSGETPEPWEDWKEEFVELKNDVEEAAETAYNASQAIQNLGVEATTLSPGSEATVTKEVDPESGAVTLGFGIPKGVQGNKGDKGDPGFSPSASVAKSEKTATITITDSNGTTTTQIKDGENGEDGFSVTANVVQGQGSARITITDKAGTTFSTIYDGEDGYSPSAVVLKKDYGARVQVTDKEGTTFADIYNGEDAVSPTASVSKSGTTSTLTVTDVNGTTYTSIEDGSDYVLTSQDKEEIATIASSQIDLSDYAKKTDIPDISGKIDSTEKGEANGVAELDNSGKVPSSQLPSYVDDVVEYASEVNFPVPGESGKIYVALDTDITYRWSGSAYVKIGSSLSLGETSSTAYRGDRGKAAYDHAVTNKGSAFASGLYKITTNSEGHVTGTTPVQKSDITALGVPGDMIVVQDAIPTDPDTKIWLPETVPSSVTVPTVTEMESALASKVDDVQVNGISVVTHGVANVPIASSSAFGVFKTGSTTGTGLYLNPTSGILFTSPASTDELKAGTNTNRPVVSSNGHVSTFYGLAKAAGDATQASSANPVGTYTDDAKTAIKSMLGVPDLIVATVLETAEIITEYDQGDDDEMIFDANFVEDGYNSKFVTVDDASTILNAYKAGKHVVLHFIASTGSGSSASYSFGEDGYFSINGIDYNKASDAQICMAYDYMNFGAGMSSQPYVDGNGKISCPIYVD